MYFPAQPPIGGQIDPAGMGQARPQFGWGGWNGWGGVPRPENAQIDPNQPVPEPGRPNQPNNAGTMPGAASPSTPRMSAADQMAAWREANPGIHKQRWADIRRPGKRQLAQQATNRQQPTTNRLQPQQTTRPYQGAATDPAVAAGPSTGVSATAPVKPPVQTGPMAPPGNSFAPPGTGITPTQMKPPVSPGGPPQVMPEYGQKPPNAGMQLSAMEPYGKDKQL